MPRILSRHFVEAVSTKVDIRQAIREWGRSAFAGPSVSLRAAGVTETVRLARSVRRMGGSQIYFVCRHCERRACVLYFRQGSLGCRRCKGLSHWSEAITPAQRRLRRMAHLRDRMGRIGSGSISPYLGPLPDKRKWMHGRTYERLKAELVDLRRKHASLW